VTGYFAPTSRHGNPDDFKFLVDLLHQNGIGVIIDWVPAHFPKDDTGLRWFDGTALYEHADPRQAEHSDWGTLIFNYGRHEVRNFLIANALFWLDVYHIDGLRVDAVASMLYLDYSRKAGEWIPNKYGGRENLDAVEFLRKTNELIYGLYPGAFTVAEESTDWGGVTLPTYLGGLGFGFKWDMGWMHDTLLYFSKDPVHRIYHHNDLTFGMLYAYAENFILPLSHDEVVHGKGSLLQKMPGDEWQRFANLRTLFAYMYTRPGRKLLFMGGEFAQGFEWRSDHSLDWHFSQYPMHKGVEVLMEDLGRLYRENDCYWAWDADPGGYQWIDCSDSQSSVVSYMRRGPTGFSIIVLNLTPVPRTGYRIGVPEPGYYREVLNTDSEIYGGSNLGNGGGRAAEGVAYHGQPWSLSLTLPPLSAVVFQPAR
jgi:1,4-alpha-glucan branching enzyme